MIKVNRKLSKHTDEYLSLEFYDSINRIPLNIRLTNYELIPPTIQFDNLYQGNFVQFRFHEQTRDMYEITVVSLNNNCVYSINEDLLEAREKKSFRFLINDLNSMRSTRAELITRILRTPSSVCFIFGDENDINYFKASKKLEIGMNSKNEIKSFYLNNLSPQNIIDIFGD